MIAGCRQAVLIAFSVLLFLLFSGCHGREKAAGQTGKRYALSGKVVSVDKTAGTANVDAKEIPGFMAAMTMPYPVKPKVELDELSAGDMITGDVVVQGEKYWLENVSVVGYSKQRAPLPAPLHIPEAGDSVPRFTLVNQDGKHIQLNGYPGKVLLLTFIYTRCPFPDYCPRVSHEFATIERNLEADSALYPKTHLLTISFDPEFDTPRVLRKYAFSVSGDKHSGLFKHWEFAVPPAAELPKLANFFGLYYEKDSGLVTHSLVAAVIGPDGRIFKWFQGTDWHAADLLKAATDAANHTS
ncbi:MAG: SCO family protein [Chlamydiota bacterium]